jgi:hypothetical protein
MQKGGEYADEAVPRQCLQRAEDGGQLPPRFYFDTLRETI